VPELLQNGKQGFIVQPGQGKQLSEAMMTLLKDPGLRRTMGAAAAARAKEKFDVSAMVRAYEELYDEISVDPQTLGNFHFHRKSAAGEDLGA
jgi:glycosyltransferase involved in cell wall biosynthesis